jgi:hypothetical protein
MRCAHAGGMSKELVKDDSVNTVNSARERGLRVVCMNLPRMGSVSIAADRSRPEDAQTRASLGSRTITNPPLVAASR